MKSNQKGEAKKPNRRGTEVLRALRRVVGAGASSGVYCNNCQPKVADLPIPPKQPNRLTLPVRPHTVVEDYELEIDVENLSAFEAAGGAA
jgi:hypothetical protein